jgi:small-conductance mechanosensitive channel
VARKRSFRPSGSRVTGRWRWEVGLPLVVIGVMMAATVIGVSGGGVIFWIGVLLAAVGTAVFLSGSISR